jgi:hypothetical protein
MKKFLFVLALFAINIGYAQTSRRLDAFDFSLLKEKTLLIKPFGFDPKFDKEYEKKNKFDKAVTLDEKKAAYTNAWKEALAISSYDATQYEFRNYSLSKLYKEKNDKVAVLLFHIDEASNRHVYLHIVGPKKLTIAHALINGLNLNNIDDIKLMFNMLNYSLNTSVALDAEGSKVSLSNTYAKYKENLVSYYDNLGNKTFLVPRLEPDSIAKNQEKEKEKIALENVKLEEGIKMWTLSNYELMSIDEINERRKADGSNCFYWRNMNYYILLNMGYVSFPILGARINMLFTADKDEQIFQYAGGDKDFNEKSVQKLQTEFTKAADKYRKQLSK